jgi:hypothetical protein
MIDNEKVKIGYWSVATQKHLKEFKTTSPNLDELDNLNTAGKTGRFLGVIRGNGQIKNITKIEKMGQSIGISKNELHRIILPELERASDQKVELLRNKKDEIEGIVEYVFNNDEVLEISGQVFENQYPTNKELIVIETMDETKRIPYLEPELNDLLMKKGYSEKDIKFALALQSQFGLLKRLEQRKDRDAIISNEYVWGPNHHKIARTIANIDFGRKQNLKDVIDIIQNTQGYPIEKLPPIDNSLLMTAMKTGMINPTTIRSSRGIQKDFAFSPNMLEPLSYKDDILDDVKLLLASIRFGQNYTPYSRIIDPIDFLSFLISNGDIGPHGANSTDYTLLEKKGIIRVETRTKHGFYGTRTGPCLVLVRKDVAEEALKIVQDHNDNLIKDETFNSVESLVDTGDFINPEEIRLRMGESPKLVKEMEDHLSRVFRDELL